MRFQNLDDLRLLCRDQAAFQKLQQILAEQEALYQQCATQIAQQLRAQQNLATQQRAAEAASQAKSQFLAMMSHELRTPLNAILGLSSLLNQEAVGPLNAKQAEYLHCIQTSGEHLLALINDILDLSKIESGREPLRLSTVDVPELCQTCLAMVEPRVADKPITLACQVDAAAERCMADEQRLRQMLLNLLANAVKFTERGEVRLTVQPVGAMVEFAVTDTGIGIPKDKLKLLFQPFTQLDGNLNRRYNGTGLGLALTQQLAQRHGGYVTVESVVNQGSRFSLYLPQKGYSGDCPLPTASPPSLRPDLAHPDRVYSDLPCPTPYLLLLDSDPARPHPWLTYLQCCGWQVERRCRWEDGVAPIPHLLVICLGAEDSLPSLHLDGLIALRPKVAILVDAEPLEPKAQNIDAWNTSARNIDGPDAHLPPSPAEALKDIADLMLTLPLTVPKLERLIRLASP